MRTIIRGPVIDGVPFIDTNVSTDGTLELGRTGELQLIVDTGFDGGIALPMELITRLALPIIGHCNFRLATGEEVEFPMHWAVVRLGGKTYETEVIPGDQLLGTGFLSRACTRLSIDFDGEEVRLEG